MRCLGLGLIVVALTAGPANALPVFAHRYGFSCQQCHTTVPHLNAFGETFEKLGFRLPNPRRVVPLAVKVNLAFGSDPDQSGLPKAIVDEIELLSGGSIGRNASYFLEQYVVDGGRPGRTRDAWVRFSSAPGEGTTAELRAGQFTLALPVDVESERDTPTHYLLYDQTVGSNTFEFFDPRLGIDASIASEHSGIEAHLSALVARDTVTAKPASGIDVYASIAKTAGPVRAEAYRYEGKRGLAPIADRFWRQGYALSYDRAAFSATAVLQTGNDGSAGGSGTSAQSSGAFVEAHVATRAATAFVARYEGTNDPFAGIERRLVFATVLRPKPNMRFTLEDAVQRGHHALSSAFLFAY